MENQIKILHQSFKQFEVNDLLARIIGIPVISYIMFATLHMGRGDLASDLKGFLISFLYNIMERYRLLTSIPVQILNEANRFEVALPLMVG